MKNMKRYMPMMLVAMIFVAGVCIGWLTYYHPLLQGVLLVLFATLWFVAVWRVMINKR